MSKLQPWPSAGRWLAAGLLVSVGSLFGWALLWPDAACSSPSCARQRFTIDVEVDALRPVQPIAFDVPGEDGSVSLQQILAAGGIDLQLALDQLDLPYSEGSGPLDRADLYQFAQAWHNRVSKATDASIYALLTTALISDTGEPLFGIMFDVADREGLAVAPATTARTFGALESDRVATLQLRTFAHELLHTLNRHHVDASLMSDGRLTLEAPTRCISAQKQRQWFLTEAPLMSISPSTIHFFQTAPSRDILPGKENSPARARQSSPTECEELRQAATVDPVDSRWELALRRLQRLFSMQAANAADEVVADEPTSKSIDLRVQAQAAAYPLGYPVAVRLMARNVGTDPLPLKGRLHPGFGMVSIEYRRAADAQWQLLKPLAWFEPVGDETAMLAADEQTEQTVPVFFGEAGWTFPEAGEYQVRVRLRTAEDEREEISEPSSVRVVGAQTDHERSVLQPLLDDDGKLDQRVGRLLTFGGRIGAAAEIEPLENAVEKFSHTALGNALRLTLISQRLRPAIDPLTGTRPTPDLSGARDLIEDTCTDSGVTALKYELLQRHVNVLPADMRDIHDGATAWDGTMAIAAEASATYSDRSLQAFGPSLHFCFNEATLRGSARSEVTKLARQLRSDEPRRVVVIGHSDAKGTCRYNDKLALRRAEAVRRALIGAGLGNVVLQTASLGERRPLDFSSTDAAQDLNRRVEILVEHAVTEPAPAAQGHVMPGCTAQS